MALRANLFEALDPQAARALTSLRAWLPRQRAPEERERASEVRLVAPVEHPSSGVDVASGRADRPEEVEGPAEEAARAVEPEEADGRAERFRHAMARRLRVTLVLDGARVEGIAKRWIGAAGTLVVVGTSCGLVEVPVGRARGLRVHEDAEVRRTAAAMFARASLVRIRSCDGLPEVTGVVAALRASSLLLRTVSGDRTLRGYGAIVQIDEIGAAPLNESRR